MKVINAGHTYELESFEGGRPQRLQFIHKIAKDDLVGNPPIWKPVTPALVTVEDGTTNEEVLRMLIDRMYWLNAKFPCRENALAITKLEETLMWLEKRTADRQARGVEGRAET